MEIPKRISSAALLRSKAENRSQQGGRMGGGGRSAPFELIGHHRMGRKTDSRENGQADADRAVKESHVNDDPSSDQ